MSDHVYTQRNALAIAFARAALAAGWNAGRGRDTSNPGWDGKFTARDPSWCQFPIPV